MTDARAAVGLDRLPWLSDEPKPAPKNGGREVIGWAVAATMLIAGVSYWMGTQSRPADMEPARSVTRGTPSATVRLPEPRPVQAAPQVPIAPVPEVEPAPAPAPAPQVAAPEPQMETPVRRERPAAVAKRKKLSSSKQAKSTPAKSLSKLRAEPTRRSAVASAPATRSQRLALWPARETRGAYGRLVQIGAFGSRQQAKLGWRRMTRAYPAVGRLPATVVSTRNTRGRLFYRFQIGTTSQAHSEVLCQRMQRIRYSCAVVGLPWKSKVER